jgi:GMP synthase (glutamine-hydrolysing)
MQINKKIAVIDFGGQYAHLISSRLRRLGAFTEILSNEESIEKYQEYSGLILSGGPASVYEKDSPQIDAKITELGIPILGICYGHQLLMKILGGKVETSNNREYGKAILESETDSEFLSGFEKNELVWMSHGDEVIELPDDFITIGHTKNCENAAVENKAKKIFGIQFHPEVTHTPNGNILLTNFLAIANCKYSWSVEDFLEKKLLEIKKEVGVKKVFMLISGGVDSTVSYALLSKALGKDNVKGLLIDTGFMRKEEVSSLAIQLRKLGINLFIEDSSKKFYEALLNKTDPEEKRKIIGNLFIEVQAEATKKFHLNPDEWLLGQGTIYPDTIESGNTKHSHKIKTHHNRVQGILDLMKEGKIIEPIRDLYKDEVRELGKLLGLDPLMVDRHPFPGPGLAVRMISSNEYKNFSAIQELNQLLHSYENLEYKILPMQSVGVQGDGRTYASTIVINDTDRNWNELEKISTEITNSIKQINRVVFLPFRNTLKSTEFHFHKVNLNREHSDLLREVDFIVNEKIFNHNLQKKIWQFPVVLVPVGSLNKFGIVLRPVESEEAMTANFYPMNRDILKEMILEIQKIEKISHVFYDITNKPPGTIEWE